MEVNPAKRGEYPEIPPSKDQTKQREYVRWTGEAGLTRLHASRNIPTEFTAQQTALKGKTPAKVNQLLTPCIPYFGNGAKTKGAKHKYTSL